jgi:hypothetical protein
VSPRRGPVTSVDRIQAPRRGRFIWIALLVVLAGGALAVGSTTPRGQIILAAVQRFLLFYSGVFALVILTAAVGVGIVATDRIIMEPGSRVVAQAVHRAVSLAALAFLATHIVLEILAHRSHVIDAFVPFLAHGRTFYIGLGTIASDLVVILVATGLARGRFAGRWPWVWRAIHATAYLAWPLSILHGLLAGRTAKPYVDWSYGGCVALVVLALAIRLVATLRGGQQTAAHPVPRPASSPVPATMPAMVPGGFQGPGMGAGPAMPAPRRPLRALPPGAAGPETAPYAGGYPSPSPWQPPGQEYDDYGDPSDCPSSPGAEQR